jgi:hypothetical protein
MRDNDWLIQRMNQIWDTLFHDFPKKNVVKARFLGKWKNKFGHIKKLKDGSTEIVVNGHFKHPSIPDFIIDLTLAHEIVHYIHGFHSPYPRMFKYPHQGNVVNKELKARGFEHLLIKEKPWVREDWPRLLSSFL